jgi:hypothetical protein
MTISWSKYLIRHGFETKCALGSRALTLATNESGMCGRGIVVDPHGSSGPGTNRKCEVRDSCGNEAMRLARLVKFSARGGRAARSAAVGGGEAASDLQRGSRTSILG